MAKVKAKAVRESRVTYRVRKTQLVRKGTRAVSRRLAVPLVQTDRRQSATWEQLARWHSWLNEHAAEFEAKYPEQYLAIWEEQVIGVGKDGSEARRRAAERMPQVIPLVTFIPGLLDRVLDFTALSTE